MPLMVVSTTDWARVRNLTAKQNLQRSYEIEVALSQAVNIRPLSTTNSELHIVYNNRLSRYFTLL